MIGDLPSFFKDPHALCEIPQKEPLLLALSGGADSAALLELLCRLRTVRGFTLYAAHVNHSIRTEEYNNEALRDELFCRELCAHLGVELFVAHVDVPAMAERLGQSLETAARDARYAFFAEVMKDHGIKALVTAHNADDNLETQIFNLCRGCGIEGISGIPEARDFDAVSGGVIIRPILSASKQEILDFCEQNKLRFMTDSTNFETDCTRNRIRHNILPELRALFTSPEKAGLRLSRAAQEDSEFIKNEADRFLEKCGGVIQVPKFNILPPSVAKRVIRSAFERHCGGRLENIHVECVLEFARSQKTGRISLPHKTDAVFSDGILSFSETTREKSASADYSLPLFLGLTVLGSQNFAIYTSNEDQPPEAISDGGVKYKLFAQTQMKGVDLSRLSVSNRREGDVIQSGGMHKKLKKLMCDNKIPAHIRDELPIVRQDGDVLFVPKCAVADSVKAQQHNTEIFISIYIRTA